MVQLLPSHEWILDSTLIGFDSAGTRNMTWIYNVIKIFIYILYIDIDLLMLIYIYIFIVTYICMDHAALDAFFRLPVAGDHDPHCVPEGQTFSCEFYPKRGQGFPYMKSVEISNICPDLLDHSKIGTITLSFSVFG